MKIAMGADSAGFMMKQTICKHLQERGFSVIDCGTDSDASCHYPVFANRVAQKVSAGEAAFGILICGTGIGMSIAANKVPGIRASVVSEHYSARYTRMRNDANVLCLGARVIGPELAKMILEIFLSTEFEGGRHARRVGLVMELEND